MALPSGEYGPGTITRSSGPALPNVPAKPSVSNVVSKYHRG